MKKSILRKITVFFLISLLISCGKNATSGGPSSLTDTNHNSSTDLPTTKNPDDLTGGLINAKPTICSNLSFNNVLWPSPLTEFQVNVFALAMNISGSFEGPDGWTNLTNNFDGQGISLGLFNQNLGQGSLQPMMLKLRDTQLTRMKKG